MNRFSVTLFFFYFYVFLLSPRFMFPSFTPFIYFSWITPVYSCFFCFSLISCFFYFPLFILSIFPQLLMKNKGIKTILGALHVTILPSKIIYFYFPLFEVKMSFFLLFPIFHKYILFIFFYFTLTFFPLFKTADLLPH